MLYLFLISIFVLCLLVIGMFLILKRTVKTINSQTKLYFVDKLQEYDYLIDNKEKQLDNLDKEIKEKESKKEANNSKDNKNNYEFDFNIIDLLNKTKYQDKDIFELNKKIDLKFNMNYIELLKEFISNVKEDNQYTFCKNLKSKFTSDVIYLLKSLTPEEKEAKIKDILDKKEYKLYDLYKDMNKDTDNIDSFINYLNELIDLNNPIITVYVGDKNENYDYLSKYIKTVYSNDIYKGIKIKYQNKIYDYSLNERNV